MGRNCRYPKIILESKVGAAPTAGLSMAVSIIRDVMSNDVRDVAVN
jgi:hypothetical protein